MNWIRNMALQKRISLLVIGGLAVALGLFSFLGIQSLKESTDRILNQRLTIARIIANDIDDTLSHVLTHLQSMAVRNELPNREEFVLISDSLSQILADTDVPIRNIILADSGGQVIQVEPENKRIMEQNWHQIPEVSQALSTGQSGVSNMLMLNDSPTGAQVVLAIVPIFDNHGETLGLLVGSLDIGQSGIRRVGQTIEIGNTGYVEIIDGNGLVIARTDPGIPPESMEKSDHPGRFADLIREDKPVVRTCHRCHEVNQELQRRRDVLAFAPLSTVSWGVAIRQSEDEALAPTRQLEMRLLFLGIVILIGALFLVWILTREVVRPIKVLQTAAQKVAVGDFQAVVPFRRRDEIGQLSNSFYIMAQELTKSQNQLVSRNRELTTLNSISVAVSQSLDLKELLESALQKVLEVTQTATGCIFVSNPESNSLEMMITLGSANVFGCQNSGLPEAACSCHQVLRHRQTVMVNDISQCPVLDKEVAEGNVTCFASIPLKSKDRVLGIMNIACSKESYFTENDFALFDSIGYQVGLAIENSTLYGEAKQKEELRGQLLSSVITAQEDERKRISRELHDESGQTLTAAIMSIESMEKLVPPGDAKLAERVQGVKSLIIHTLEDIRRLTHDLRPMALDDLGLASAIRTLVKNRLETMDIQVKFETKGLSTNRRLTPIIETALFRIIQEATNNIIKHAEAHNVQIRLVVDDDMIRTVIEDDGKGFDVKTTLVPGISRQSLGLLGIKERVTLLGGTFNIKSKRHQGTRLTVEIPAAYNTPNGGTKQQTSVKSD